MKALLAIICLCILTACSPRGESTVIALMTPDELAYLHSHTAIRVGGDASYEPFVFKDKDALNGLAVDMLKETMKRLGLKYEITFIGQRAEVLQLLKDKQIDMTLANRSAPSRPYLSTTQPYVYSKATLLVRSGFKAADIKKVGVGKGYAGATFLKLNYPLYEQEPYETEAACIPHLRAKDVDACLVGREAAFFHIDRQRAGLHNFEMLPIDYDYILSFGIHVDNKVLQGILIKGLESIPISKKRELYRKWLREPFL